MPTSPLAATLLTLAMLGAFALILGGFAMLRRRQATKGALMFAVAVILVGNVLIWTV